VITMRDACRAQHCVGQSDTVEGLGIVQCVHDNIVVGLKEGFNFLALGIFTTEYKITIIIIIITTIVVVIIITCLHC